MIREKEDRKHLRIKIEDLPLLDELAEAELKGIFGGDDPGGAPPGGEDELGDGEPPKDDDDPGNLGNP